MDIYTAQYKYTGDDRLDITVKSSIWPGSLLAPTWPMVHELKSGKLDESGYTIKYYTLLLSRTSDLGYDGKTWRNALAEIINLKRITLVCFCPINTFCHRILAARILEGVGIGVYRGEWQI